MSASNTGPEPPASGLLRSDHRRKSNPEPVYRDGTPTGDIEAASTRAVAVSHRFGGARHALSRPPHRSDGDEGDPHA